jgi:hypothetical protein
MRLLSYLFLLASLVGFVLCVVVRLFYPNGIYGVGLESFYSFSFLSAVLVIAMALMRVASKD